MGAPGHAQLWAAIHAAEARVRRAERWAAVLKVVGAALIGLVYVAGAAGW